MHITRALEMAIRQVRFAAAQDASDAAVRLAAMDAVIAEADAAKTRINDEVAAAVAELGEGGEDE